MVVQNLPSERKLPMGKVKKNVKKTNNSVFSATHTYIKLTLVSFMLLLFFAPSPNNDMNSISRAKLKKKLHCDSIDVQTSNKGRDLLTLQKLLCRVGVGDGHRKMHRLHEVLHFFLNIASLKAEKHGSKHRIVKQNV